MKPLRPKLGRTVRSWKTDLSNRSRYKRCKLCKKIRLYRMEINYWHGMRRRWTQTPFGKICLICTDNNRDFLIQNNLLRI